MNVNKLLEISVNMSTTKLTEAEKGRTLPRKFLLSEEGGATGKAIGTATSWKAFVTAWVIVVIFAFLVIFSILSKKLAYAVYLAYLIPFFVIFYAWRTGIFINKERESFWVRFAEINGWNYHNFGKSNTSLNSSFSVSFPAYELFTLLALKIRTMKSRGFFKGESVMMQQGMDRQIFHQISGVIDGRNFKIFTYHFSTGIGEHRELHFYTVFVFKFNGHFPHLYLNNKHNHYNVYVGENVPLPAEFSKQFTLSVPRKYEIEALEIFTPDVLEVILDGGFAHDIELVDQELLFFSEGIIDDVEKLEKEFTLALALEDILDEKLDRMKFEKIGDMPSVL